jgi:FixJ family two-component response regulator
VDFLAKPVNGAVLLERVQAALDHSVRLHKQASARNFSANAWEP